MWSGTAIGDLRSGPLNQCTRQRFVASGVSGSTRASFDEICASIFAGSASSLQVGSRPPTSRSRSIAARRRERSTISG